METSTFEPLELGFEDEKAWELICSGKTKGVFQLESNLGKSWAKRVQPKNIEELSALISIIRPGTLKAIVDGKSMTQHYVDRKNGVQEITYLHNLCRLRNSSQVSIFKKPTIYAKLSVRKKQTLWLKSKRTF